jgi:hypothetical protein
MMKDFLGSFNFSFILSKCAVGKAVKVLSNGHCVTNYVGGFETADTGGGGKVLINQSILYRAGVRMRDQNRLLSLPAFTFRPPRARLPVID